MSFLRAGPLRRSAAAVGVTCALLLGAGCSGAAPGVVAYVGKQEITQKQVDSAVAGVSTSLQPGQKVSTEAVINVMIQGVLAEQIAADRKVTLTDAARDQTLKGSQLEPLLNIPGAKGVAYDVADQALVAKALGSKEFLAAIQKWPVTLNPRYGVLDPKQKIIVADKSASLSTPAPAATPS